MRPVRKIFDALENHTKNKTSGESSFDALIEAKFIIIEWI